MGLKEKLLHELKAVGLLAVYFGCWLVALLTIKQLILAEYHIEFHDMSKALVGVLILSKVVLVLEHVPLGNWVSTRPAWVDVVLRTILYAFGVFVVICIERAFEGRGEYGGIVAGLRAAFQHADIYHVLANTLALTAAILGYNMLSVIRQRLGKGTLLRMFTTPIPREMTE
jgi:hypothetical protein